MRAYYEQRAAEYDATSYELLPQDPVSARDLDALERLIMASTPGRVLDIGCGTGWLTRFIRGEVVAVDQSQSMLRLAAERIPRGVFIRAFAPPLPFADDSFDTALTSHVYSHIESEADRSEFLSEALRVASELIIVEQAWRPGLPDSGWEERPLRDGSHHSIYKRYFTAAALANEVGGRKLLDTVTFVAVLLRLNPGVLEVGLDRPDGHEEAARDLLDPQHVRGG
jgi:SAM-dependent methyltransferase